MSLIGLLLAILLPWMAGTAMLGMAGRLDPMPGRFAVRAGYGYFLGIVAVYFAVTLVAQWREALSYGLSLMVLALLGLAACSIRWWRTRKPYTQDRPDHTTPWADLPHARTPWLWVLGVAIAVHLALSGLEIVSLPLFPWDAWTVWTYRAKAWFFQNAIFGFVDPATWLAATDAAVYSHPALRYPLLPSVVPLWAAMGMGAWHEALINVPTWCAGVAIAVAGYGMARTAGLSRFLSWLGAYLLLSTPIFATHMSLGGYADIWMAGFAGLGFMALITAYASGESRFWWLGGLMLAAGVLLKAEGALWLLVGAAFVVTVLTPRKWFWSGVGLALVCAAVLLWGVPGTLELPGIGRVGYTDGVLYVPIKGGIPIQPHNVLDAYAVNLFVRDNWKLFWLGLVLLLLATARVRGRDVRAVRVFLALFVLSQVLVFGLTSEGQWAEDYTAINRLPLHIYPAAILAALILLRRCLSGRAGVLVARDQWRRLAGILAAALALTVLGLTGWSFAQVRSHGPVQPNQPVAGLRFVVGEGDVDGPALVVRQYEGGVALASSGKVEIDADRLVMLQVRISGDPAMYADPDRAPAFFWRRAGDESTVHRHTLAGTQTFDDLALERPDDWQGSIVEMGFVFMEGPWAPPVLESARLESLRVGTLLGELPREWFEFEPWTQISANSLSGGAEQQHVPLPALVSLLVMLAAAGILVFVPPGHRAPLVLVVFLAGWGLLDARWLANRVRQAAISIESMAVPVDERRMDAELGRLAPWVTALKLTTLGEAPARILLVRDPEMHAYFGLHTKYTLLPHSTLVLDALPGVEQVENLDYVLMIGDFLPPGHRDADVRKRLSVLPIEPRLRRMLQPLEVTEEGVLLKVNALE